MAKRSTATSDVRKAGLVDSVERQLASEPEREWAPGDLAGAIEADPRAVVVVLASLTKDGLVDRLAPGRYRLARRRIQPTQREAVRARADGDDRRLAAALSELTDALDAFVGAIDELYAAAVASGDAGTTCEAVENLNSSISAATQRVRAAQELSETSRAVRAAAHVLD